jgi:hypothetical protein
MSYLKLLLHSFWPNAEGVREAMRISYAKHLRLANAGRIPTGGMTPHEAALYGALASRYRALGQVWCEGDLLVDLAPFLRMDASDGAEAIAEYAALKECPKEARASWLKKEINQTIRKLSGTDRIEMEREPLLFVPLLGLTDKQIEWWNLLGEQEIFLIMERHHRSLAATESNDDPLQNEIADSVLRKAGYRPDILREAEYQPDDDEAESRAKALRQLFADQAQLRRRINALPDDLKSAVLKAHPPSAEEREADEMSAEEKEAEEIFLQMERKHQQITLNFQSTKHRPFYRGNRQQVYRFDNGYGVSLVPQFADPTMTEAALIKFDREPFRMIYDHPTVKSPTRDLDSQGVESFLDKVKELLPGDQSPPSS